MKSLGHHGLLDPGACSHDEELTGEHEGTREVGVRVVGLVAGERTTLKPDERISRVEWNGKKFYLIIVEESRRPVSWAAPAGRATSGRPDGDHRPTRRRQQRAEARQGSSPRRA